MSLDGLRLGFALTASSCTFEKVLPIMSELKGKGVQITPVFSRNAATMDTRFGQASHWLKEVKEITGTEIILDITGAEPIGPQAMLDLLLIAPCTGNTLSKLAQGITDDPVLMAAKAQLRNNRPVLIAIATNDGLGSNALNLAYLLNAKNIFFVPFGQDDPLNKHNSLVAHMEMIPKAIEKAIKKEQIQPVLLSYQKS